MTKQDYIELAKTIKENQDYMSDHNSPEGGNHIIYFDSFLKGLCEILKSDNPRFDEETFRKACED